MHKKHILFILEYFPPHIGWVETLFTKIVEGVLAAWHEVSIVTSRYDQGLPSEERYAEKCMIYRVGHNRFDFIWYGLKKAKELCHTAHIDLIHATTFMAALPAGILRKITKIPTVLHVHEIYGKLWYRFIGAMGIFSRLLEDIIFSWLTFDKYLCVSHYTKNNLRIVYGISDDKLMTVYNAIDYAFWDVTMPLDTEMLRREHHLEEKKIVLFFGRPWVAKGLDDLIEAIPETIRHTKNVHFVLIVPQDTKKKAWMIRSTIDEQAYHHIFTDYAQHITQIPGAKWELLRQWIATADLVVLPSHAEWFGFAIAEVCAMHKPLITTNVSAIPEVVSGEIMFVEPQSPRQIAETISSYVHGNATVIHIPEKIFTWDTCIHTVLSVYEDLLTHKWLS